MTLSYVYDPMLNDMRPATEKELLKMQKEHLNSSWDWKDPASYRKYFAKRLSIRKALADHKNAYSPPWMQLNKK